MSNLAEAAILPVVISPDAHVESKSGLTGQLTTADIVLATLAYAGPLAGTVGYVGIVIGYGNGLGAPLAMTAVTLLLLLFSVGYSAATRVIPNPGAFYAYITAGFGRNVGLGSAFLILCAYILLGIGFYGFAGIASKQFVEELGGPVLPWWFFSFLFWISVTILAYFHIAVSAKVLGVLLIAEVLAVLFLDLAIIAAGGSHGLPFDTLTWDNFTSGQLGIALVFGINLFAGFEATAIYREETINPSKTIPRATIIVVLLIGFIYALTAWCMIAALGPQDAVRVARADPAAAFFHTAHNFGGAIFVQVTSILLLTSTFAAHLAVQNVTTRYVFSLAVDGVFPRYLSVAHPRHQSPHRSSVACSMVYFTLTALLCLSGLTVSQIYAWGAGLAAFAVIIAMALTSFATVAYFRNVSAGASFWESRLAPAAAGVGLICVVILAAINFPTLISGSRSLSNAMIVSLFVVFAIGYYWAHRLKRLRPEIFIRIGRQSS